MTQKGIRDKCELLYKQINDAQEELDNIRNDCKHPNKYQGHYSWRVGNIQEAIICYDCGKLMKYL